MENVEVKIFRNAAAVADALTKDFQQWAQQCDSFHLALSGGSTPKLLFQQWAKGSESAFHWNAIHFWWCDERCVPPDDPESNFGVVNQLLFSQSGIQADNIHRMIGESDPQSEANRYQEELRRHVPVENELPCFDLVLLGVGSDGHTASIFPDQMELLEATTDCAVATHPTSGQQRVTLTGPVLNNARKVAFLITGPEKKSVVRQIVKRQPEANVYPANGIRPTGPLMFYLDQSAASELE